MSSKYWMQKQAPAGNWTDWLGTESLIAAIHHAEFVAKHHEESTRVVVREDRVVWPKPKRAKRK